MTASSRRESFPSHELTFIIWSGWRNASSLILTSLNFPAAGMTSIPYLPARYPTRRLGVACALLLVLTATPGLAADMGAHEHDELPVRADLSLAQAVSAALPRAPVQSLPLARQREAETLGERAGSLISGAPALQLRHQNDRWQTRQGVQEWEAGVELPLWRWGQRSAIASEAGHARELAGASLTLRNWQVAGEVREAYWQTRLDGWLAERAGIDLKAWQQLEQDVLRRIKAGDAAPAERLTAEGGRRERELLLHEAEVRHIDSQVQWRLLTGLDSLPGQVDEAVTSDLDRPWPPVAAALALRDKTQDALDSVRALGAGSPRLLLGSRRDITPTDRIDSLTATLTLPFGGGSHQRQALVQPQTLVAEAADNLRQLEREATLMRHEAGHELEARRQALDLVNARLALVRDEVRLSRRAYVLGEINLNERLLSEQRSADAERQQGVAMLALGRAIARYNQAWGVLP